LSRTNYRARTTAKQSPSAEETWLSPRVASELARVPLDQVDALLASGRLFSRRLVGQTMICLEQLERLVAAEGSR
jgi:hypothetical protein